jgi:3-isopropylmalate dehydratase large subunit
MAMQPLTLYDKVWEAHAVKRYPDGSDLIYIDRHLVQEVSSPQAFDGLVENNRPLRRPDAHISVADHAVPTRMRDKPLPPGLASRQVSRLIENSRKFAIPYIPMNDRRHGIVHVIGPELGFTLPGATLVCGDSHTCTHGAFGALAFGIGASECEMVFATQTLRQRKQKRMRVTLNGALGPGVAVKDIILALIAKIGTGGGFGHAIEYAGPAIDSMSMEARMTLCNMSIEAGSRVGMVAPDETTFAYLKGRPLSPAGDLWQRALADWSALKSDPDAVFDTEVELDVSALAPHVSWGTTPEETLPVTGSVPDPSAEPDPGRRDHRQADRRAPPEAKRVTMEKFTTLTSIAAPFLETHIDTDIIFPARFLLLPDKKGLGEHLFHERRHAGTPFVLDTVWALADFGIRCVIAPSFGEIFFANCFKNGVLPIVLSEEKHALVAGQAESARPLTIDLEAQ